MNMLINRTSNLADMLLAEIEKQCENFVGSLYLEFYQNGRETGYALISEDYLLKVVFGNCRNVSNLLVVYFGETRNFNLTGNVPDQKAYDDKCFYSPDNFKTAASEILSYLCGK